MDVKLKSLAQTPLLLEPNRVWRFYEGGKMIERFQGNSAGADSLYPEEWVGSTVQAVNPGEHYKTGEGLAVISRGLPEPVPLKSLTEQFPEEMLGAAHVKTYGTNSALLVKLLDSAIRLLIHAHPTKAFALEHLNSCFGKTEAWFVLSTRPEVDDPYVLIAFREEIGRKRYRELLDKQDVKEMMRIMHRVSVRAGDVVYVKAGLPHAIGEGTFMVELQEPTDFSILLERSCAGFTLREDESFLGLDPSLTLSVIDHRVYSEKEVQDELVIKPKRLRKQGESAEYQLLGYDTTECFAGHRLEVRGELGDATYGRFSILIVLDGEGKLQHRGGEIPLRRGTEIFLPASIGEHVFQTATQMTIFKSMPARV
ncbi:MAG: hypothetical protein KGJ59_00910 [Bacteroidota bacterium]|nr:hypothetical protein [Bacteroidota bacterium]